jgi:hypothetical protein
MNLWGLVVDWRALESSELILHRREMKSQATAALRPSEKTGGTIRKADGIVRMGGTEFCYIEASRPGDTHHLHQDRIKLCNMMKFGLVDAVNNKKSKSTSSRRFGCMVLLTSD